MTEKDVIWQPITLLPPPRSPRAVSYRKSTNTPSLGAHAVVQVVHDLYLTSVSSEAATMLLDLRFGTHARVAGEELAGTVLLDFKELSEQAGPVSGYHDMTGHARSADRETGQHRTRLGYYKFAGGRLHFCDV